MNRILARLACLLLLALTPLPAAASGAWQTFLRPTSSAALLAERDTVWIGTGEAGLIAYIRSLDRFEATAREPGGLASNTVTCLAFDRSRRLWAGTPGAGVSRLSADRSTWDLVNAFDGLPGDSITALRAAGDTMWIGTTRGIALWDGSQISGSVPDAGGTSPFGNNSVVGIVVRGDSLFVATGDGVYVARLSDHVAHWTTAIAGLFSTAMTGLATDGHELFALASNATYRWNDFTGQWGLAAGIGATRRLRDDFGHILSVSPSGGYEWRVNQWVQLPGAPISDGTLDGGADIAVDADDHAWGSYSGNLDEQASGTWTHRVPPGPVGNDIQNLTLTGSRVYAATYDRGLSRFDGSTWRNWSSAVSYPIGQDSTFINPIYAFALMTDRYGRKWSSHWDVCVERFDDTTEPPVFRHVLPSPGPSDTLSIHTLMWSSAADSEGYVYLGGDTNDRGGSRNPIGIDVYDSSGVRRQTWKSEQFKGLLGDEIRALSVDHYGNLWVGYPNVGVSFTDLTALKGNRTDSLPTFTGVAGTESRNVFGIVAHGDSIWALAADGLQRIDARTGQLQSTLLVAGGQAARGAVHPLDVGPDGSVWAGTVAGVRRSRPGGDFTDYTSENSPLANDEVRAVVVDPVTGVVWIGTAAGLNRFDPDYTAPAPPRPAALHLKLYPNPITLSALGFGLRLAGNTTAYRGQIVDLSGRVVRTFTAGSNGAVIWDGRDQSGTLVRPGMYFVHALGGGREALARVVVLR